MSKYDEALDELEALHRAGKIGDARYAEHKKKLTGEAGDRRRKLIVGVGILALLVLLSTAAVVQGIQNRPEAQDPPPDVAAAGGVNPEPEWVRYEVDGENTDQAAVTYRTPDGTQQATVALPMMNDAGEEGVRFIYTAGQFLYISAQNQNGYGSVTCQIYIDDTLVSENTSSGAYAIASCEA